MEGMMQEDKSKEKVLIDRYKLTPLPSVIRVTNSSHCEMIASGGASPSTKGQSLTSIPSLLTRVAS
jgi:hypothetical protein